MTTRTGFTLLEIMVAVGIIMLLTSVGVASYASVTKRSRDVRRTSDVEQVRQALEMYRSDYGYYPNTGSGSWTTNLSSLPLSTYMPSIPNDPKAANGWANYQYSAGTLSGSNYYSYCLASRLEAATTTVNTCTGVTLPSGYNYGLRSP